MHQVFAAAEALTEGITVKERGEILVWFVSDFSISVVIIQAWSTYGLHIYNSCLHLCFMGNSNLLTAKP